MYNMEGLFMEELREKLMNLVDVFYFMWFLGDGILIVC